MKKNKMLRLASGLLVLTLLSTSIIGGTFAKYVTTDSGTDTARVAKFGVVATVSGDLFGSTYTDKKGGNTITSYSTSGATVKASDENDKVVAPGTENKTGLTLSVAGTPEVSTKVKLGKATDDEGKEYVNSDIYLKAGEYGVMVKYTGTKTAENIVNYYTKDDDTGKYTKAVAGDLSKEVYELRDTANLTDEYYPLTWHVDGEAVDAQTAVDTALETKFNNKEFAPNKPNNLSVTVGWAWEFEDEDDTKKATRDAKDTILGDMISAKLPESTPAAYDVVKKDDGAETYSTVKYMDINSIAVAYTGETKPTVIDSDTVCACLTVAFGASITVEQVD